MGKISDTVMQLLSCEVFNDVSLLNLIFPAVKFANACFQICI